MAAWCKSPEARVIPPHLECGGAIVYPAAFYVHFTGHRHRGLVFHVPPLLEKSFFFLQLASAVMIQNLVRNLPVSEFCTLSIKQGTTTVGCDLVAGIGTVCVAPLAAALLSTSHAAISGRLLAGFYTSFYTLEN